MSMVTASGGKKTAHVGRQWLANIGKTESGVVSVSSLWADESVYWPVAFEPYTPSHPFAAGKEDPAFRTKLKIASQLVEQCVQEGIPFRAVVADSFYGEDEGFKQALSEGIDRERELRAVVLATLLSRPKSQT